MGFRTGPRRNLPHAHAFIMPVSPILAGEISTRGARVSTRDSIFRSQTPRAGCVNSRQVAGEAPVLRGRGEGEKTGMRRGDESKMGMRRAALAISVAVSVTTLTSSARVFRLTPPILNARPSCVRSRCEISDVVLDTRRGGGEPPMKRYQWYWSDEVA